MDNKRIVELEIRIMKIESVIEGLIAGVNCANNFNPQCGVCGANPLHVDECTQPTCPHGLSKESNND